MLSRFADWDPSAEGIDNLFGVLFFTAAILVSMTRKVHAVFGGVPDAVAFRGSLSQNLWSLTVGIVIVTTLVNLSFTIASSWSATGEVVWPSPLRTAILCLVHGILARVVITESLERMRYA
ncbi:hypothetical protein ACQKKX_02765 [Neorhizobium sp. NPDC001467]|uniref:hypothetical protein n=1 Tax=Neorhizobium sp. NPDC001467 TaxID=3390595 RepID=UPI003CFD4CFC